MSSLQPILQLYQPLQWRHNGHNNVSKHQSYDCLLNRLFDADQRKHQSSASVGFERGIHWGPMNSLHKWPVMRKMFPFDDFIMKVWVQTSVLMTHTITKQDLESVIQSTRKVMVIRTIFKQMLHNICIHIQLNPMEYYTMLIAQNYHTYSMILTIISKCYAIPHSCLGFCWRNIISPMKYAHGVLLCCVLFGLHYQSYNGYIFIFVYK